MLGILVSFWDEFSGAILVLGSVLLGNLPTENMYCNKRTISVFFGTFTFSGPLVVSVCFGVYIYTPRGFSCCSTWKDRHVSTNRAVVCPFPGGSTTGWARFSERQGRPTGFWRLESSQHKSKNAPGIVHWEMGKTRMYIYACLYLQILCNMYNLFPRINFNCKV